MFTRLFMHNECFLPLIILALSVNLDNFLCSYRRTALVSHKLRGIGLMLYLRNINGFHVYIWSGMVGAVGKISAF